MLKITTKNELDSTLNSNVKCIVKIGTETCGPCKVVEGTLAEMEKDFQDIKFISVDAEETDEIVDSFSIRNIPTIMFVRDGNIVEKVTGLRTKGQLATIIKEKF